MHEINDFSFLEKLLLPHGCKFSEDARAIINCWESKEIVACPGSGKTTVLIAKLKLIAERLPFSNGRGICVLSHTNVAVDELKNKLGNCSKNLFLYPNFIGTIQTFIDQYIAFPYLRQYTKNTIQVVSDDEFCDNIIQLIKQENSLLRLINVNRGNMPICNFIKDLHIIEGNLVNKKTKKNIANRSNDNAKKYKNIIEILHFNNGIIRYGDAYTYAFKALNFLGDTFCKILSNRFAYVFVDEYQDCSAEQREILDKIFLNSETIFQKIGDIDQAIYQGANFKECPWKISSDYLSIVNSNRYGQEIANILKILRTEQAEIISSRGDINIPPTLLVYNNSSRLKVIPAFIKEIKENKLIKSDGIYKAIGMVENVEGLKISDYWEGFIKDKPYQNNYLNFIEKIRQELISGNLYIAEEIVQKLLCRIFVLLQKKENDQKYYTIKTIRKFIADSCDNEYKEKILELAKHIDFSVDFVDTIIKSLLVLVLGQDDYNRIPENFMQNQVSETTINIYYDNNEDISIKFDTVHGVKGETHDATLYLETETYRGTDLARILNFQKELEKKGNVPEIYQKARKCVYVGWSRPKNLLCVAIRNSTYNKNKSYFNNWKIIEL